MSDPSKDDLVCVGAIAGAFGVRGEARIKSFCAQPEDIADYAPLYSEDGRRSFTLKIVKPTKGGFVARLGGLNTREQVEAMRGFRLFAPRGKLPALPDDEFYYSDLVGLTVVDTGGVEIGVIRHVAEYGAGDFLEIRVTETGRALLVPFTRDAVPTVDLAAKRVVVDPPEDVAEPEPET